MKRVYMAKFYKFDSGLTVLYEQNKINKSTSIEVSFDCGARCDDKLPGLSHFCEHMFFTGTNTLTKQEVTKRYYDFINVNAYTTNTEIVFTGNIITNKLSHYLATVADMICNSTFKQKAVEDEQKVVVQEILQYSDNPIRSAEKLFYYDIYGLEYLKNGVLGSVNTVTQIKSKDVKKYIKKYFVKNNCIISVVSPLSFNRIKQIIKKYFEALLPSNNLTKLPYMENVLAEGEKVSIYNADISKNYLSLVFKFKQKGPDLKYRVIMGTICNIIDDISDGLTKELRIDNSLIYGMGSDYMINKNNSYLELRTEISSENIKSCIDIIMQYISNLKNNGFTKQQLARELEKDEYYWQTKVNKPKNICNELNRYRFYGKFVSDKQIHKEIQKLTLVEVNDRLKELLSGAQIQAFVYGNTAKNQMYTIKQIKKKFN